MLAFDIETTGLDPASSVVTVVCTQDFHTGERRAYEFGRVRAREPQNVGLLERELVEAFDAADSLCAFNGVRFDIPFLHAALRLSQETTAAWLLKTTDILEAARLGLFGPAHTFSLNLLCQHNQVPVKSGKRAPGHPVRARGAVGRAALVLRRRRAHPLRPLPPPAPQQPALPSRHRPAGHCPRQHVRARPRARPQARPQARRQAARNARAANADGALRRAPRAAAEARCLHRVLRVLGRLSGRV